MRITRRKLKIIIESFLHEEKKASVKADHSKKYVCPSCGHVHDTNKDRNKLFSGNKCVKCGTKFDPSTGKVSSGKGKGQKWGIYSSVKNESKIRMLRDRRHRRKRKLREASKETKCPTATTDISVNTANRDRARKLDWIIYGPLNVEFPGKYWEKIAKKWGTDVEAAKKSNCGVCVAFDRSPKMVDECIPAITSEPVADEFGVLGYCWMHHFKCHSARTCNTWAAGGPIKTNESSGEWFDRNKDGALKKEPIDPNIYKDDTSKNR